MFQLEGSKDLVCGSKSLVASEQAREVRESELNSVMLTGFFLFCFFYSYFYFCNETFFF